MADLKLARLPDRTPLKLTIAVMPELHQRLGDYALVYAQTYGSEEPITELIPAMLAAFLDSDREFIKARRGSGMS
ncbi:MAG: transposase [Sphingomonas sp. 28-66-16]|nr:MAG: transposase [Sphingomonas sp. 28-66-16]